MHPRQTTTPARPEPVENRLGISRREFLQFCGGVAATLGLSATLGGRIAQAVEDSAGGRRPAVIWLSGQECTGCTESLLRATHPTLERLILDLISLDYHETLSAAAGHQAEAAKQASMDSNRGQYLLVVDGSIPTRDGGIYCKIADKTFLRHVEEAAEHAAAIIAIGSCASWGGIPSSGPNPTGAKGVPEVLPGKAVVTIPGCPPNPYNFLSTVLHFVTFGTLPALDQLGRPRFAYGRLIHENCERRAHFD
ncbi:MAG: hydrogenase small subunit, partial [Candidatus Competibacterales bacterium]|nr:hydrogenase small subunit [Candidatus Competibacterales bacterium]